MTSGSNVTVLIGMGKIMNCVDRMKGTRVGELALIYSNGNKVEFIETNPRTTFETGIWRIMIKGMAKPMVHVGIYHPNHLKPTSTQLRNLSMIFEFLYRIRCKIY